MELRHYLAVLAKRWILVVLIVAGALGVAYATTSKTHYYVARSTIVVGPRTYGVGTTGSNQQISGDVSTGLFALVQTYADLIPTQPIAQAAINLSQVPRSPAQVVGETKVEAVTSTQVLNITVTDQNPIVAAALVNNMAKAFVNKVNSYSAVASVGTLPSVPVYVFETAQVPTVPLSTGLNSNLIIAGVFGLLGALGVVALLEYLDITVKSAADAERRLGLPVLGTIPFIPQAGPEHYQGVPATVAYQSVRRIEAGR